MRSENDSQELKVDLAKKNCMTAAAVRPVATKRWVGEHHGTPELSAKAWKVHQNLENIAGESERHLEGHEPCHFKVKLVSLSDDKRIL